MLDEKIMNKIIRKKVIWAEVKVKEQEYKRIQKQIDELEEAKAHISFQVQEKLAESQKIAEYLDGLAYETMKG